ncbi:MAG: hypothetical protein NT131_07910 [Methanomassiliicoccales archaeon]|nr:hypothetical protein [Methanomassiliicoccales archaeon]
MKFTYCPDCLDLRPRSWHNFNSCAICGQKSRIIAIPMSIYGYLTCVLSVVGAVFVVLEMIGTDIGLGDYRLYVMFGSLILAMVFYYIELNRTTQLAIKMVGKVR